MKRLNRIHLLEITSGLRLNQKRERNVSFLKEVLRSHKEDLYLTYEMTLFLYNVVLNSTLPLRTNIIDEIVFYYEELFELKMNEISKNKVLNDVEHIELFKKYTKVSILYLHCYNAMMFFFSS